jgi:hypothetical protein
MTDITTNVTTGNGFYGGKMMHSFKHEIRGKSERYSKSMYDGALKAIQCGNWFYKIDGSNGLLIYSEENNRYEIYRRFDDKKGKYDDGDLPDGLIRLPIGKNTDQYGSESQLHRYYQSRIERPSANDSTKDAVMWRNLYRQVDKAQEDGKLGEKYHSIELVGKNFSGTPKVEGVGIALHSAQVCPKPDANTLETEESCYEYFYTLFEKLNCEGIVVEYDGLYWKMKADCFRADSPFKLQKNCANPPILL